MEKNEVKDIEVELLEKFYTDLNSSIKEDKLIVVQEKEAKAICSDTIKALKKQATDKLLTKNEKEESIFSIEVTTAKKLLELSEIKISLWNNVLDTFKQLSEEVQKGESNNHNVLKAGLGVALSHKNIAQNKLNTLVKPIESVVISTKVEEEVDIDPDLSYDGFNFATKKDLEVYVECVKNYADKYILLDLEGESVVSQIVIKKNIVTYKHRRFPSFLNATCDDIFYTKDKFGNPKKNYFNQLWLETKSMRKRYEDSTFEPDPNFNDENTYNFWKGFVEPQKGSVQRFYDHVNKLIVGTDKQKMHLIKQMAWSVRFPHDNFGVVPAFRGKPGCGKSTLSETFLAICPNHTIMTSDLEKLLDGFNGETVYVKYFLGEEALWGGDKRLEGKFKHAVTGKQRTIEIKNVTKFNIPNYSQFFLTSNEKWIMPVGDGDRRGEIFDCTDTLIGNFDYFNEYHDWLYGEGKNALVYHFMYEIDLEGFNPRELVETKAKLDVKLTSLGHVQQFLYNALNGDINDGALDKWADVEYQPKRQDLYEIFKQSHNTKVTIREFSQTLAEIFAFPLNWKDNWKSSSRGSFYKLGNLKQARESFCKYLKHDVNDVFYNEEQSDIIVPKVDENKVIQIQQAKLPVVLVNPTTYTPRKTEPVLVSKTPTKTFSLKR